MSRQHCTWLWVVAERCNLYVCVCDTSRSSSELWFRFRSIIKNDQLLQNPPLTCLTLCRAVVAYCCAVAACWEDAIVGSNWWPTDALCT